MPAQETTTLLRDVLILKLGISEDRIDVSQTLADLGIDSLAGLEMVFELEERFATRLPPDLVSLNSTLAELGDRIEKWLIEQKCLA
jgi:acyl carrier protein